MSVDDPEPYFALSYVWGDPNVQEHDLICSGRLMKITSNLWIALKAVWSKFPTRRLWVDAICINQDNIPERNQQVAMMGDIYSRAECVAIWVGEATPHSDDFFKVVEVIKAGDNLSPANCPNLINDRKKTQDPERDFMYHLLDCATDIVRRPWFIRAWTFQEIRLAKKACIHCGAHVAPIGNFVNTVTAINRFSTLHDFCGARTVNIPFFAAKTCFMSLYRLLALSQYRASSDPRDKVYSLLSMLPYGAYEFMKPDYSLSYEEVFAYACRVCIEVDKEMNVLGGAGLQYDPGDVNPRSNLPSWAVDWRVRNENISYWRNLSRSINIVDPEALCIRNELGTRLDPASRSIRIPGTALGRFRVYETKDLAFLMPFPKCVMKRMRPGDTQNEGFLNQCTRRLKFTITRQKPSSVTRLSDDDFAALWQSLALHDDHHCNCRSPTKSEALYKLQDMPRGMETGDWLWTTTIDEEQKEPSVASGEHKDEIHHFHYGLRPVGGPEPCFQLVGKTNGLTEVGPYAMASVKIQAKFLFV
ncbi:HET-domain-containing protein [Pleurotus eryngii]|uniref:HET-domain-containing protein n=1 Tax=Pleurotus eryngii TaxID=5323 RepID=A0A9P6A451_PLEER|nr:HET-domain-containing protein [Pleurotus eryngii]